MKIECSAAQATPAPAQTPAAGATPAPADVASLAQSAQSHYQQAEAALKNGDWATYGRELQAMEDDLQRLIQATNR